MGLFKKNKPKERMDVNFQDDSIQAFGLCINKQCTEQDLARIPGLYKSMDAHAQHSTYRGNVDVYWDGHRFDAVTIRFKWDTKTSTYKIWDVIIRRDQAEDSPDFCEMLRKALGGKKGASAEGSYSYKKGDVLYIATSSKEHASLSISFENRIAPFQY